MAEEAGFDWAGTLGQVASGRDLTGEQAEAAMDQIMVGEAEPAQIAAFIVALRMKGETVDEITGLARGMRRAAVKVDVGVPVVDTAGTGGDRSGTFNISTIAALIAAGSGVKVAKHGNRSASSWCGSADVLEGLGVPIELPPEETAHLVREVGFGFFYAPQYHPAMRHAGPVRRQLGIPTVFNFLGPLANPAGATRQAVGVSDPAMAERMIGALQRLGGESAFVYHGEDGLDELTTTGPSVIYRLKDGEITHAEFTPEDFGVTRARPADLLGGDVARNVSIVREVLSGRSGPRRDIALVNAAPAIVASGQAPGFREAMTLAERSVDSGAAALVLERLIDHGRSRV